MNEQSRTSKKSNKRSINWWKWAFFVLITFLLFGIFQLFNAVQPVSINEPNSDEVEYSDEQIEVFATINREDTEQFINTFLSAVLDEEYSGYFVEVNEQLEVHGELEVFQFNVPFTLSFDPYVLENGNVQLRADAVQLGSLSLPVSVVMGLLVDQLEVPDFIAIDSDAQMIVLNLNELSEDYDIAIELIRIDLAEDEIEMNLRIHEDMILDNFTPADLIGNSSVD